MRVSSRSGLRDYFGTSLTAGQSANSSASAPLTIDREAIATIQY